MKPVQQTLFAPENAGNCASACVASILELSIDDVPNFGDVPEGKHQFEMIDEFLQSKGWRWIRFQSGDLKSPIFNEETFCFEFETYAILSGRSPRGQGLFHAVVGKMRGYDIEFIHDPHPDGTFIDGPVTAIRFLIPPEKSAHCCYIDENGTECDREAKFWVGKNNQRYTHSCPGHVYSLIEVDDEVVAL